MTKILTAWTTPRARSLGKRLLALTAITLILAPVGAQAAGLGDLLSLIKTITSTLQKPIGGVLSEIQKINSEISKFRQEIVWPLNEINQARAFVSATRARYTGPFLERHYKGKYERQNRSIAITVDDVDLDLVLTARRENHAHGVLDGFCSDNSDITSVTAAVKAGSE